MPDPSARRKLGAQLRAIRKTAGLSGVELANRIGSSGDKISKTESGRRNTNPDEITRWVNECGGTPGQTKALLDIYLEVDQNTDEDWADLVGTAGQGQVQSSFMDLLLGASDIAYVDTLLIPGPLQTDTYARATLTLSEQRWRDDRQANPETVEAGVRNRTMGRAYVGDPSKQFTFVLSEASLGFMWIDPPSMVDQLDHVAWAAEKPNVWLGIIPMYSKLAEIVPFPFILFNDHVRIETAAENLGRRGGIKARYYRQRLEIAKSLAVTGSEAKALIRAATERLGGL